MTLLSFHIPEQHKPGPDDFATTPEAVEAWIAALPVGHTGETTRQLYEMLHGVNRLEVEFEQRYELLERIGVPLQQVLVALERHYNGVAFPLSQKALRVANLSSKLLTEMVIGYHAVLNAEEESGWFFRQTHKQMWAITVQRMLHYIARILFNYRLIHRHSPAGLWIAIHRLFNAARKHKRLTSKVPLPGGEEGSITIEQEYRRSLLLAMLEPQLFSRPQLEEVMATFPHWVVQSQLYAPGKEASGRRGYCVCLDQDVPMTLLTDECGEHCFLLDLQPLNETLQGYLAMNEESHIVLDDGDSRIDRETLETLITCWRQPEEQREQRVRSDKRVEVVLGMSAIHRLIGGGEENRDSSEQQNRMDELRAIFTGEDLKSPTRQARDVWSNIFYATEFHSNAWVSEAEEHEYRYLSARQVNYNRSGMCLELSRGSVELLQAGELAGVRNSEQEATELYVVRWLSDDELTITLGLQQLGSHITPAAVKVRAEGHDSTLNALLGIGNDGHPLLLLPHLPGLRQKELALLERDKENALTLYEKVALSPLFVAFHFETARPIGSSATEEMDLEALNERIKGLSEEMEGEAASAGDFSDLWQNI